MKIEDKKEVRFGNFCDEFSDTVDESSDQTLPGKPFVFTSGQQTFFSGTLSSREVTSSKLKDLRKYFTI
jgi:hypothetical protein